jgi:ATP-dependent Clp protease protease subunit
MTGVNIEVGHQEERWVRFYGGVNVKSASALMQVVDKAYQGGTKRIHLMMSSTGGDVVSGQTIVTHCRALPVEFTTYNMATVQSIAVPIFCIGDRRYCLSHSNFMIHPMLWQFPANQLISAEQMRINAGCCEAGTKSIAEMIALALGKDPEVVLNDMQKTKWFNPIESIAYGLTHEIVSELPTGIAYTIVQDDGEIREVAARPAEPRISPDLDALLSGIMFPSQSTVFTPPQE